MEIEETLVKHRDVLMAAAVGKADPVRGQVVKAFVVLREESEAGEDLAAELKGLSRVAWARTSTRVRSSSWTSCR